jgi:hypothetical protein
VSFSSSSMLGTFSNAGVTGFTVLIIQVELWVIHTRTRRNEHLLSWLLSEIEKMKSLEHALRASEILA